MRRITTRIVALVVVGAIVTICVAAASIVLVPPERMTLVHNGFARGAASHRPFSEWSTTERAGFGVVSVNSRWSGHRTGRRTSSLLWVFDERPRPRLPDWACSLDPHDNTIAEYFHFGVMESRGWPFAALRGGVLERTSLGHGGAIDSDWALVLGASRPIPIRGTVTTTDDDLGSSPRLIDENTRLVPLRPYLPGFLANTAIYCAAIGVVGLLWLCPAMLRRLSRRRRGACESCGHFLAGLDRCPECGESNRAVTPN